MVIMSNLIIALSLGITTLSGKWCVQSIKNK
jgi:hypothetical protein